MAGTSRRWALRRRRRICEYPPALGKGQGCGPALMGFSTVGDTGFPLGLGTVVEAVLWISAVGMSWMPGAAAQLRSRESSCWAGMGQCSIPARELCGAVTEDTGLALNNAGPSWLPPRSLPEAGSIGSHMAEPPLGLHQVTVCRAGGPNPTAVGCPWGGQGGEGGPSPCPLWDPTAESFLFPLL